MSNLTRRLLRQGFERAVGRVGSALSASEGNVADVFDALVKSIRSPSSTRTHSAVSEEPEHSLSETLLKLARSVESLTDLRHRITAHRGEFIELGRSSRRQLAAVLAKMVEPGEHSEGDHGHLRSLPASNGIPGNEVPPDRDE